MADARVVEVYYDLHKRAVLLRGSDGFLLSIDDYIRVSEGFPQVLSGDRKLWCVEKHGVEYCLYDVGECIVSVVAVREIGRVEIIGYRLRLEDTPEDLASYAKKLVARCRGILGYGEEIL